MITLLGALTLSFIAWINHRVLGSLLYPPCLFAVYWAIILIAISASGSALDQPSLEAVATFVVGAIAFSIGGLPAMRSRSRAASKVTTLAGFEPTVLNLALIIELALLPAYITMMAAGRWKGDLSLLLISIRTSAVTSDNPGADLGLFKYAIWMSAVLAIVSIAVSRTRRDQVRAVGAIAMTCLYYGITASRLGLTVAVLSMAGSRFVQKRRIPLRGTLVAVIGIIAVFGLIGVSLDKIDATKGEGIAQNLSAVATSLRQYALGGPVAFSATMANRDVIAQEGSHVGRVPLRYLQALGLNVKAAPLVQSYSYIPDPINVYSVYFPFYADYGVPGVLFGLLATGFTFTMAFEQSRRGSVLGVVAYGISFAYILLSAADEYLFTLATSNMLAMAALALLSHGRVRPCRARVCASVRGSHSELKHARIPAWQPCGSLPLLQNHRRMDGLG